MHRCLVCGAEVNEEELFCSRECEKVDEEIYREAMGDLFEDLMDLPDGLNITRDKWITS